MIAASVQVSAPSTKSFKDLIVWQKAYQLVLKIYKITEAFPKTELYGLASQIRKSAVSIPSNIAEGYGRRSSREYRQFLAIAYGSRCELETQYLLAIDLGFASPDSEIEGLIDEVGKILYRLNNPER